MKSLIVLLALLLFGFSEARAQFEKNCPAEIPNVPIEMTYKEYRQLVRDLNWKRIGIAAMVPGYIHFYAEKKKAAYSIAAVRATGMALSAGALFRQWREAKTFRFVRGGHWETNFAVFIIGMMANAAGYAFDWAHGDWIIEKERTLVQYKYGIKRGMLEGNPGQSFRGEEFFLTVSRHF